MYSAFSLISLQFVLLFKRYSYRYLKKDVRITYFFLNFTMQSMQRGLSDRMSMKTFAGCMSSR